MIEVTGHTQLEAWRSRTMPPVEQVSRRVWSIPVDCSHYPIRYTIAYAVANDHGDFLLIDPGPDTELAHSQVVAGISAAGLDIDQLRGVVITHFHIDHLGGAHALSPDPVTGPWVGIHQHELDHFRGWPDTDAILAADGALLDSWGAPHEAHRGARFGPAEMTGVMPRSLPTTVLRDGMILPLDDRNLQVLWTPGHTSGHICVVDHDEQLLFSGDHVLPRITSNISSYSGDGERDAMSEYFAPLDRVAEFDDFEVCPAHEYRFIGIAARAAELRRQHEERHAEVLAVLRRAPDASVWEIAQQVAWSRGWDSLEGDSLRGALGETRAHVDRLRNLGIAPSEHGERAGRR